MKVPRYWSRASGAVDDAGGGKLALSAWGWSETNQAEADARATERFQNVVARVREGSDLQRGYAYGSQPVREEIIQEITDGQGGVSALVTRNRYGSLVLNTEQALFLDVDLPKPSFVDRLRSLFGGGRNAGEAAVLDRLRRALQAVVGASFRIYRTAAGFRALATDPVFQAGSMEAEKLMAAAGTDKAFVHLCRIQKTFRARLTPKPWRCGQARPPGRFPREDNQSRQFADWLTAYDRACETVATCRFVEEVGRRHVHAEIAGMLRIHDEATKAHASLPLA